MTGLPPDIPDIDIQIPHRNWNNALEETFALMIAAQPGDVICITGPSRAGKSRLIEAACNLVCGRETFEETGYMPCVVVDAANTGTNGLFSTKSFMHRMLEAIQHPIFSTANVDFNDPEAYQKLMRASEAQLRMAFERGLIWRKTKYLIIDEAQHARYSSKGSFAGHALMDSWKCLAQATDTTLVIVGAYPILDILRGSPHLLGRKHQIHLPRYYETVEDLEEFGLILAHYDQVVTLDKRSDSLQNHIELLYEGTFGCIGLLRGWLTRANALSSLRGCGIDREILLEKAYSSTDLGDFWSEIKQGEKLIASCNVMGSGKKNKANKTVNKSKEKPVRKGKPFQCKPMVKKKNNRTESKNYELSFSD